MSDDQCHLLGGTFSTLVQATLGILCVSALVIKRHNEVPQRDWFVWFLDMMKQGEDVRFYLSARRKKRHRARS